MMETQIDAETFWINQESDDPRDKVLAHAVRLFTKEGYFNTSMPDLVEASGVSNGSIYHHFQGKEGVAKALFEALTAQMQNLLEDIDQRYSTVEEKCGAIVLALFEITEREPETMEFMLYAKHKEFLPDEGTICSSKPFEMMRELVASGIENGEIRPMNATVAAASVFGAATRLLQLRLDGLVHEPLVQHFEEIWQNSWSGVARK